MSKEVKISAEVSHTRRNLWPSLYILFLAVCGCCEAGREAAPEGGSTSGKNKVKMTVTGVKKINGFQNSTNLKSFIVGQELKKLLYITPVKMISGFLRHYLGFIIETFQYPEYLAGPMADISVMLFRIPYPFIEFTLIPQCLIEIFD